MSSHGNIFLRMIATIHFLGSLEKEIAGAVIIIVCISVKGSKTYAYDV